VALITAVLMVALGTAMIALGIVGAWLWRRGRVFGHQPLLVRRQRHA
jgi:uncharacterized iron-regulated membrane protein